MSQIVTVKTENKTPLKPLLESAITNERQMLALGLERTRQRLAEFEAQFDMDSTEFLRRLHANVLEETPIFSEWRMEIEMYSLLESKHQALEDVQLD